MDLVILAGGLGHRYGGDKQIDPVDEQGDFLMDYSIFDAVRCGFDRIIFVIRPDLVDSFQSTIIRRISSHAECTIVIQDRQGTEGFDLSDRRKPLGTAHALMCCEGVINGAFAMINADDYYGYDAFKSASEFIKEHPDCNASISYDAGKTISPTSAENRGICQSEGDLLTDIIESSVCRETDGSIIGKPHSGGEYSLEENSQVSMNMFVFSPELFTNLREEFASFLNTADLVNDEFLIPNAVRSFILNKRMVFRIVGGHGNWFGMTYHKDKERVINELEKLKIKGIYPKKLWECS